MNQYGAKAMTHWRRWLPDRYAQITDPQTYFTELGEQMAFEIDHLASALTEQHTSEDPPSGDFLKNYRQRNTARQTAESTILREYLPNPENEDDPEQEN
ncbi:hypothetical protein [Sciscionella marina]|uniref:hypothetical protein n=1 Tax=Sciscionella marina TaxID=508770 RepID=UPI00036873EE|nr:hypothetical protein [Sciscionella marina]